MTTLIIGVFTFFLLHTFLLAYRSLKEGSLKRAEEGTTASGALIMRFNGFHRAIHVVVAVSFLGLVISGMPLRYAHAPWAVWIMELLGGPSMAGLIHRICAVVTFGYFFAHVLYVLYSIVFVTKLRFNIIGPDSMVPWIKDLKDIHYNFRWFFGQGPRPHMGRWAYWEKFDYWAVFWGVGIIGVSGLFLWFPEYFGRLLPGWVFNIATIIHSDEALLAAGFIFTIHFFNTHLRPEKFPMDTVIFTGTLSVKELEHERPLEYRRLKTEGRLQDLKVLKQPGWLKGLGIIFGAAVICTGFLLLILIMLGQFYYE
jgi:cytochrome b subunit of formate dehydrogenase